MRNRQLDELARLVVSREWVLVIGDLNVTPFSPYFRRLLDRSGLVDARQPQGIHVTWPAYPIPLWIPIDHGLASPGLPVTDVRRGPDVGADHYPLEITIDSPW